MSAAEKPYDPAVIKDVLCRYFNMSSVRSQLSVQETRFLGLGGPQSRYFRFKLTDGSHTAHAFGKTTLYHDREYRALQYLTTTSPEAQKNASRPIASLQHAGYSFLLLEYLHGYSSPLTIGSLLRSFPTTTSITHLGRRIIDKIYLLQKQAPFSYTPLSFNDTEQTPAQPVPVDIFVQLGRIKSLSIGAKQALERRLTAIISSHTLVRRGLVHGQLGMRNIFVNHSDVMFIDWEYMQSAGFCLFDPCYMAIMLLMRAVQLLIASSKLDIINRDLFEHIRSCEESITDDLNSKVIADGLSFAKAIAMIDTLYEYEAGGGSSLKALVGQKYRKIKYLTCHIEKDAANGVRCEGFSL